MAHLDLSWNMDYSKDTQIIFRKKVTFFYLSIRMNGKSINVGGKKIKKSNFYKNKKIFKIDNIDGNKILISEKEPCAEKSQLNISLDIIIRMLLELYA